MTRYHGDKNSDTKRPRIRMLKYCTSVTIFLPLKRFQLCVFPPKDGGIIFSLNPPHASGTISALRRSLARRPRNGRSSTGWPRQGGKMGSQGFDDADILRGLAMVGF